MDADRAQRVSRIFVEALTRSSEDRVRFIAEACAGSPDVRTRVEALLQERELGKSVFDRATDPRDRQGSNRPRGLPHRPGEIVSHYRLGRQLGVGGMGEVYAAEDLVLGRRAALKLLPEAWDEELRARLLREAKASARLEHPGIATFYESGEVDGVAFLAMEYVDGETLRSRLQHGALPLREALALTAGILEALTHAHAMNILHRDIKPENIMVRPDGSAKLLDFGLARRLDAAALDRSLFHAPVTPSATGSRTESQGESPHPPAPTGDEGPASASWTRLTQVDAVAGTPGYMSPEQIQGLPLGPGSDLFAVGAVLYEMVSGRPAFGGSFRDRLARTLHSTPDRLSGEATPAELQAVLDRALAVDESARFPTAASFLSELRGIGEGPIAELPDTLAVLDFKSATGNLDDEWIGTALGEGLTTGLAQVSGLEVVPQWKIARAQAALPSEPESPIVLGARLGCRWVLVGSFERAGTLLQVTARLCEVCTNHEVGIERVEGALSEIVEIQNRLLGFVGERLRLAMSTPASAKQNVEAHEYYARGRRLSRFWQRGATEQAAEFFEKAIEADANHAASLSALAMVAFTRYINTTDPQHLETSIRFARRAIELDPSNAEPHVWLGYALWRQSRHAEAISQFRSAEALDPGSQFPLYFVGCCLSDQGRHEEALGYLQRAVQREPGFSWSRLVLGWVHLELGRFEEARWSLEQAVALEQDPVRATHQGRVYLAEALRRGGDLGAARGVCLEALDFVERSDVLYRDQTRGAALCALGRTALEQGDGPAAQAAFSQALAHVRGRPEGIGHGHLIVQALAGQTRAQVETLPLEEAMELFEDREHSRFNFGWGGYMSSGVTLLELARASQVAGLRDQARSLLQRARAAGSGEALRVEIV